MPIALNALKQACGRSHRAALSRTLSEAKSKRQPTAYLSYSPKDEEIARGLQVLFSENGWNVHIDWDKTNNADIPDMRTASSIKDKIAALDWFIFLGTPNSTGSLWLPWELGFADGKKSQDKIIIVSTTDEAGRCYGDEYTQLYRHINQTKTGTLAVYNAGMTTGGGFLRYL